MPDLTLAEEGISVLFGTRDENLRKIESAFGVQIAARGSSVSVTGTPEAAGAATHLLEELSRLLERGYRLRSEDVTTAIRVLRENPATSLVEFFGLEGGAGASGVR